MKRKDKYTKQMIEDKIFTMVYYSDLMTDFIKAKNFKMVHFCSEQITRISNSIMEDLK